MSRTLDPIPFAPPARPAWRAAGLALAAVAGFALVVLAGKALIRAAGLGALEGGVLGEVLVTAFAALVAVAAGGFARFGLTRGWTARELALAPGLLLVYLAGTTVLDRLSVAAGLAGKNAAVPTMLAAARAHPLAEYALLAGGIAVLAAVSEELFFRGFLIEQLSAAGLPGTAAVVAAALLFGLAHLPGQGVVSALGKALVLGLPAGLVYRKQRGLGAVIVFHALADFLGFMAAFAVA